MFNRMPNCANSIPTGGSTVVLPEHLLEELDRVTRQLEAQE